MPQTRSRFFPCSLLGCFVAVSTLALASYEDSPPVYSSLTAHEWGTFTSIAGALGQTVEWSPLTGSTDLPSFVEHFRNSRFKLGLRGTVRMETPVLYFYDSREENVSVKVSFLKGVITEWYPHATRVEPMANLFDGSLYQAHPDGTIAWDTITVAPTLRAEFPHEAQDSHYYSARQTSATPLRVQTPTGEQREKFLFYRGVSTLRVPLSARLTADGKVQVKNEAEEEIPNAIRFERRGEQVGYRIAGAIAKESALDPPELTGNVDELGRELVGMLVAQGLYVDEAQAMVATWRSSWFEEGSRLLYIVPRSLVTEILPLSIDPAPADIQRVFVGRMELVTSATKKTVDEALAMHDAATLQKYSRFLEPILVTMVQQEHNPGKAARLNSYLAAHRGTLVAQDFRDQ